MHSLGLLFDHYDDDHYDDDHYDDDHNDNDGAHLWNHHVRRREGSRQ